MPSAREVYVPFRSYEFLTDLRGRRYSICEGCGERIMENDDSRAHGTPTFRPHNVLDCLQVFKDDLDRRRNY